MESSDITEIINAAVSVAIKAASQKKESVKYQPAFWVLMFIMGVWFMMSLSELEFAREDNIIGKMIKRSLKKKQSPEVRAFLIRVGAELEVRG